MNQNHCFRNYVHISWENPPLTLHIFLTKVLTPTNALIFYPVVKSMANDICPVLLLWHCQVYVFKFYMGHSNVHHQHSGEPETINNHETKTNRLIHQVLLLGIKHDAIL